MAYGQKQTDTLPRFHSYIREATLGRLLLKTNGCNGSRAAYQHNSFIDRLINVNT